MSKRKAPTGQGEGKNRTTNQQVEGSVMTKVGGADPGVNRDAVAESNVIEMPRRCEGKRHPDGVDGHEGNAAWIVTAVCPSCAWADVVLMCDGRVQAVIARDGDFSCGTCGHTFHWAEGWTLSPLGGVS